MHTIKLLLIYYTYISAKGYICVYKHARMHIYIYIYMTVFLCVRLCAWNSIIQLDMKTIALESQKISYSECPIHSHIHQALCNCCLQHCLICVICSRTISSNIDSSFVSRNITTGENVIYILSILVIVNNDLCF